jgi:ornithine cyclodeaminase/alanine dehydrogenase-like protein (mu-crystallin family)
MIILTDDDVDLLRDMPVALEAVEAALRTKAVGGLVAPPRHGVGFPGSGKLLFTIGGDARVAGFRVYDTFAGPAHTQVTAVWSTETAELLGLVLGDRLGELRTGAIGGIAVREMSAPGATTIGIVGSGQQARSQLLAAAAVRPLTRCRIFSRDPVRRRRFAQEMSDLLGFSVEPVDAAEDAVNGADIVICATASPTPVLDAAWLKPGAHVNTVGPKTRAGHEIGVDVAQRASVIATDSLAQTRAYAEPFFLEGADADRMVELADIVAGQSSGRNHPDDITLFCSTGLAGTEVLVAERLLRAAAGRSDVSRVG